MDSGVGVSPAAVTNTYSYDANGNRLTMGLPNALLTTRAYDALNRVLSMASLRGTTNVYTVGYGYDLVGNRLTATENLATQGVRTNTYGYDAQYRLTNELSALNSQLTTNSYTYDLAGNRLTFSSSSSSSSSISPTPAMTSIGC